MTNWARIKVLDLRDYFRNDVGDTGRHAASDLERYGMIPSTITVPAAPTSSAATFAIPRSRTMPIPPTRKPALRRFQR